MFDKYFLLLPQELQLRVWEEAANSPRVVEIRLHRDPGSQRDWRWTCHNRHSLQLQDSWMSLFDRNMLITYTHPMDLEVSEITCGGDTPDSSSEHRIRFAPSFERDTFLLGHFHQALLEYQSRNQEVLRLWKKARRVVVRAWEILLTLERMPNDELEFDVFDMGHYGYGQDYMSPEEHFLGPLGDADSAVEEYIVLLDRPRNGCQVEYDYLVFLTDDEVDATIGRGRGEIGQVHSRTADIVVHKISLAWVVWGKRNNVKLPELRFAGLGSPARQTSAAQGRDDEDDGNNSDDSGEYDSDGHDTSRGE